MSCFLGHKWNGCKCNKCGKIRDEGHIWGTCNCTVCGALRPEGHDWDFCKCQKCGLTRDEEHNWEYCKCKKCGKPRNANHIFKEIIEGLVKCSICNSYAITLLYFSVTELKCMSVAVISKPFDSSDYSVTHDESGELHLHSNASKLCTYISNIACYFEHPDEMYMTADKFKESTYIDISTFSTILDCVREFEKSTDDNDRLALCKQILAKSSEIEKHIESKK